MQIHELNTFSGTPSSSDYLIIDNGTDTAKISSPQIVTQSRVKSVLEDGDALLSSSTITLWKGILGIS